MLFIFKFLDWNDDLNINKWYILFIIYWCSLRIYKLIEWKLLYKKERILFLKWIIFFLVILMCIDLIFLKFLILWKWIFFLEF